MKGHIRRFVNEKNDVVTAEDMKVALESDGSVKGCHFIVAEVHVESTNPELRFRNDRRNQFAEQFCLHGWKGALLESIQSR